MYSDGEKNNHPAVAMINTGISTPKMVMPPMRPVIPAPLKFGTVVSQITAMVYRQVGTAPREMSRHVAP